MIEGPFAVAVAAGMAASVNPCGFVLLPAYLAMFVGDDQPSHGAAVVRALRVSGALTAGFVATFALFGVLITPVAISIERYLPWVTIVIGLGLVGLGAVLAAGGHFTVRFPRLSARGGGRGLGSMFWFGVSYAVASLSCTIGPFLAVTSSTFTSRSVASGVATFVAYGLGMGVVIAALTVGVALAQDGLAVTLRRALPYVSRASGVLLVAAGAYVAWYGWFEVRTLAGGDGRDPIVDRATALQGWLQDAIVPQQPLVWLGVAAVLLAAGVAWSWSRARRRHRRPVAGHVPERAAPVATSRLPSHEP